MAISVGEAFLAIVPDMSKFRGDLDKQVAPAVESTAKKVGTKMRNVGLGMTAGVTLPLVALGKTAITAFQESETIAAQTVAGLESTAGASNMTAASVAALAGEVSAYAAVDDEAVQAGENLLLTFTNVRDSVGKGRDIFTEATKAGADLAARGFGSIESNAVLMGKALNDPLTGMGRLAKAGVELSASQKETVERLVETGDVAGAQGVLLDEVFKQVGGSAKAFGETSAGSAARAKVSMGNAMEEIGAALAPIISQIADLVGKIASWFSGLPAGAKTAIVVIGILLAVLGPLLSIIGSIIAIAPALGTAFSVMFGPVGLVVIAIVALIAAVILLIKNWDTVKRVALAVWRAITGAVSKAWHSITRAFGNVIDWLKRNWPLILAIITGPIGLAVLAVVRNWDKIKGAAKAVIDWLRGAWRSVADFVKGIWRGVSTVVSGIWDGISSAIRNSINFVIDGLNVLVRGTNVLIRGVNLVKPGTDVPSIPEIPHLAGGGLVVGTGIAVVHAGETVTPAGAGSRIVGELTLTPDSRAYVQGVVWHEGERSARHARAVSRMGRRS